MNVHRRTAGLFVGCWATLWGVASSVGAADLRTTVCDRPVCRTVAITADPGVKTPGTVTTPLLTDEVFDEGLGGCAGDCGSGCDFCCFPRKEWWGGVDFLLGWRHGIRTPPLVTTDTAPNTQVVYPLAPFGEEARPGGRASLGVWLDPCHCWGLEGRLFMLADQTSSFSLASTGAVGTPVLARPVQLFPGVEGSRLLAYTGFFENGSVTVTTESQFSGGDAMLHRTISRWEGADTSLIVGYQFARLDESLVIQDSATNLAVPPVTQNITDRFATRNQYHAVSIGSMLHWDRGPVRWEILGKVGLGNMRETVTISGETRNNGVLANTFGLLAQGTNVGTFTQDKFCASPELNVKCVYQVSDRVDVSAGYTFLYLTSVAQPGNQIDVDRVVPATAAFRIRDSEYWMHAFQCGVTVQY